MCIYFHCDFVWSVGRFGALLMWLWAHSQHSLHSNFCCFKNRFQNTRTDEVILHNNAARVFYVTSTITICSTMKIIIKLKPPEQWILHHQPDSVHFALGCDRPKEYSVSGQFARKRHNEIPLTMLTFRWPQTAGTFVNNIELCLRLKNLRPKKASLYDE